MLLVSSSLAVVSPSGWGAVRRSAPRSRPLMPESGMRLRNLGFSEITVSELALGTQRWGGTDFNSPDEATCHQMLDIATSAGVTFVDTAEQYPIPSGPKKPEGTTERIIGSWLAKDLSRRQRLVIASKITGGGNVTPRNIEADLQGTLKRLGTDYLDIYLLHWPARCTLCGETRTQNMRKTSALRVSKWLPPHLPAVGSVHGRHPAGQLGTEP